VPIRGARRFPQRAATRLASCPALKRTGRDGQPATGMGVAPARNRRRAARYTAPAVNAEHARIVARYMNFPRTTGWTRARGARHDAHVIRIDTIGDLARGCAIYAYCKSRQRSARLNLRDSATRRTEVIAR
jgi:hypothetical protein